MGESTRTGLPSTFTAMPPIRDRLSNFHTCAQESLAEMANMPKTAPIAMLHLLIKAPRPIFYIHAGDVDASCGPLQSPQPIKNICGEESYEITADRKGVDAGGDCCAGFG